MVVRVTSLAEVEPASAIIRDPLIVGPDTTVQEAIASMNALRIALADGEEFQADTLHQEERSTCVLVVENHCLIGIFTEHDIIRLCTQGLLETQALRDVITTPLLTLRESEYTDLLGAIQLLHQHRIHHLPIVDDQDYPVGFMTQASLLQTLNPLGLCHLVEELEGKVSLLESAIEALIVNPDIEFVMQQPVVYTSGATRWQFALEGAGDGVWDWDLQTNHVLYSPHWKSMLGYDDDDVGDQLEEWSQRIHPDDIDQCFADLNHYLRQETPTYQNEHRIRCKDGRYKWILDRGKVVKWSPTGQPLRMIGTHTDISDRKHTEEELRRTEKRLQEAQRIAHMGSWELNLQTNALYWSKEIFRIFEIDPQQFEASYETFLNAIHPEDRDWVNTSYQEHLRDRTPYNITHRLLLPDGRIKYVQEQCESFYAEDGTPLFSQGVVQDITNLKQAQLKREQAEDALRQVIEGTATTTGGDFFPALVKHIAEALEVRYVSVSQATTEGFQTLAFFADGNLYPPELLPYTSVPCCVQAMETGECCYPNAIQTHYPGNELFQRLQVESYLGTGLRNAAGEPSGNLCILHDRPLANPDWAKTLLRIFAARAGAELERYQTALALEQLTAELEQRVQERTAQLQEREAHYRGVMDHASDAIILANSQGRLVEVNQKAEELLGYSQEELTQLTIFQIHPPEVLDAVVQHFSGIIRQDHGPAFETLVLRKDGSRIPVDITGSRLELNGEAIGQGIFRDVRDRKQAENALRESQQFLQTVLDTFPLAVFWKDRNLAYLGCNRHFLQDAGLSSVDDLMGKTDYDMPWAVTNADEYRAADQQVIKSQAAQLEIVETLRQASGQQIWLETNKFPLYNTLGELVGVLGTYQDISERKQAEFALQTSENRFRRMFESNVVGMFFANFQGQIIDANDRFLQMLGYKRHDLQAGFIYWDEITPPEYVAMDAMKVRELMQHGSLAPVEKEYYRKDGSRISVLLGAAILPGMNDQAICIAIDISDRKQAEQIIRHQAEREVLLREITQRIRQSLDLQTIFDTACQEIRQVLQADRVGIFKFYPNSGYDEGEFVAESVIHGYPSVVAIRIQDHCFGEKYAPLYIQGRYAAMEDIYQLEICHTHVLAQFQVRANLVMPLICGDDLWGLLCIHQCSQTRHWNTSEVDLAQQLANQLAIAIQQANLFEQLQQELTERQQTQLLLTERNQQLAISNEELARATRLKDEFLANMSHELRTPLNAILGMTEGLQEEVFGSISEQQRKALSTVEDSATHLLSLINDILDVAKIESGQIELERMSVSPIPLCSSSLAFIKHQALKKRIQLETNLAPNLPHLLVDERRICQVLINLLSNAVKFTPEAGKVTLSVSPLPDVEGIAEGTEGQTFLRIAVTDSGIGISPDHIDLLFKPFVQIDSALNRQYSGTGLGLSLVKQIVELHGGRVGVTSEPGVGSCFTVDLPADPETPTSRPIDTTASSTPPMPLSTNQDLTTAPLILLAEDNEANVGTVVSYLGAKGYRILLAKNGPEAIALAQAEHPDLILMDVQMPGMDGLEVMQHLRQDPELVNVPIIALTALAMAGDRERCLTAGANEYLAKPVKLKQLASLIQRLLPG